MVIAEPGYAGQGAAAAERAGCACAVVPDLKPGGSALTAKAGPAATAAILHTSGTTGAPKQVLITQERLANRVAVSSALDDGGPRQCVRVGFAVLHIAGLGNLAVMVAVGATVLPFPRFSVEAWQDLGSHGVTHAFLVPTMIERLLDATCCTIPGLRLLQYGSAPIRPATLARAVSARCLARRSSTCSARPRGLRSPASSPRTMSGR